MGSRANGGYKDTAVGILALVAFGYPMNAASTLPPVTFWLPKPMNVYSSLFRCLAANGRVDLRVFYWGRGRADLFDDGETGMRRVWNESLLEGYPSEWCTDQFGGGFRAGWAWGGRRRGIGVLAGTEHAFSRGLLAGAWLRRSRVLLRYDATLAGRYGSPARDRVRRVALRLLFGRSFRLGYTSRDTREYLLHYGARETQLWRFPYLVDHDLIQREIRAISPGQAERRRTMGIPTNAVVVVAALKFNDREAPLDLIDGFALTRHPDLRLVLVGNGPLLAEVKARVGATCPGRVILAGFLPYPELLRHYGLADIFVHPAHLEVWGVSVNEAMVAGLAVVASDSVGAARELIRSGENGLLYPVGAADALAEALDRLAGDPGLRRRLAAAGAATIAELAPACWAERLEALAVEP